MNVNSVPDAPVERPGETGAPALPAASGSEAARPSGVRRRAFLKWLLPRPKSPPSAAEAETVSNAAEAVRAIPIASAPDGHPDRAEQRLAEEDAPPEPLPRLQEKLSEIEAIMQDDAGAEAGEEDAPDGDSVDGGTELPEDPGPLTLSLMELQARTAPKPPQIRAFPWLRG